MGKEILTFGNIEIEKKINFTTIRLQFLFFGGEGGGGGRCRYCKRISV